MAIGTPYSAATTVTSTATSASDTITQNADVPQGDTLFIIASTRLASATNITSITNDKGIGFTAIIYPLMSGVQNGDGWIIQIYASTLFPGVTGPATWTLNYNQSPTRHCLAAMGVSGVAQEVADQWHSNRGQFGTAQPTVTTRGNVDGGELAIGQVVHIGAGAQGETGTPSTNFTEFQDGPVAGVTTPFLHQYTEYRIMPAGAATTVTSAPTFLSDSGGILDQIVVFRPDGVPLPANLLDDTYRPPIWSPGPWTSPIGFFEDLSNVSPPVVAAPFVAPPRPVVITVAPSSPAVW